MNSEIENRLRALLETSSAEDLVPGFNKDALWTRIEPRVQRRAPLRIALPWLSHAAAVAAGLLLAWMVLPRGEERPSHGAVCIAVQGMSAWPTALRAASIPVAPPAHTVVKADGEPDEKHTRPASRRSASEALTRPDRLRSAPAKSRDEEAQAYIATEVRNADVPVTQTVAPQEGSAPKNVTTPKQPAPVVVHLIDMTGESGDRLRKPVEPLPARRLGFFARLLSRAKVPDLTGTAASDAVVQRTYLSR